MRFRRVILRTSARPQKQNGREKRKQCGNDGPQHDPIGPHLAIQTLIGRKFLYSGSGVNWRTEPGTQALNTQCRASRVTVDLGDDQQARLVQSG